MTPTDPLFKSINISVRGGWLTLAVAGNGSASFQLAGIPDEQVPHEVDRFAEVLKAALRREPIGQ